MAFGFFKSIIQKFTGRPVDWDELEEALIRSDLGVAMTMRILKVLQARTDKQTAESVVEVAREEILKVLPRDTLMLRPLASKPKVVLIVGVNGTGKTTSTAKLAYFLKRKGHSVMLAAADTFRAAAIEQLGVWAERIGCPIVQGQYNGDPAAVCFEAYQRADRENIEFLLCDTAGRLHTKTNLMGELAKVKRTLAKCDGAAPHECLLVVDATTGGNALNQTREFHQAAQLTGLIVTKLDGSGKGGCVIAIQNELSVPTRFVGTGEQLGDLAFFESRQFVEQMLSRGRRWRRCRGRDRTIFRIVDFPRPLPGPLLQIAPAEMHAPASLSKSRLTMVLAAAFLGWMFDGMEMGMFPLVARPALQEMQALHGIVDEGFVQSWMGVITALFLLGAAAGGLVFGWLGDRIGRVRAMTLSILTYSVFAGVSYFAREPWQLGALRCLGALGMGGEWSLGVALVMECWPANRRPLMAALIGVASNLGYALIAVIGMVFTVTRESWRWVMLVGAVPAVLTLAIRLFVPESERWIAATKLGPARPLREIFAPALRGRTLLAIAYAGVALIVTWGIVQWLPLWADQMTQGSQPRAKAYTQFCMAIGASVGSFAAPLLGLRCNRRPVYFGLCLSSLLACGVLFHFFDAVSPMFFAMVAVTGACTASFYGWLPQYLPELFPTRVRATGQGLAYNFGRILAAIGAWRMGALMGFFGHSYARAGAAISLVYLAGMTLIWLAPETRGKPLPD